MKRLTKSYDKKLAGVCAGISEYFNPELDPIIVRIGFVGLCIFNPLMLIAYLVLAIVLPDPGIVN
ncbi:PspC domain-containing protein [Sunxiuqinia sp. sy24]|uniref:PspC domain-containing protein n=1 Tax=Sunxiuqinia sp. sy24 TaxID=3461495 RepID=UPI0040453220